MKGRGRHGSSGARWSRSFVGSERVGGSRVPRRGVGEWGARETLGGARSKSPAFFGGELKKRADHHATPVKDLEITRGALVASGRSAQPGTRARSEARQSVAMTLEATDPKVRPPPHPRRHPPQHPRVAPHPPKARVPNLEAESEYPLLEIARELHPNIALPPRPDSIRRRLRPARPPPRWRASRTRSPTPS